MHLNESVEAACVSVLREEVRLADCRGVPKRADGGYPREQNFTNPSERLSWKRN